MSISIVLKQFFVRRTKSPVKTITMDNELRFIWIRWWLLQKGHAF